MESLEARQARVEAQVAALKDEVAQKAGGGTVADSEAVEALQKQLDQANYRILHLLRALEEAEAKPAELEAENAKLQYRVTHLLRSLEEAEKTA